jgi:tRNA modification GTPase
LALADDRTILIITKSDIQNHGDEKLLFKNNWVTVSAQTGEGIGALLKLIEQNIATNFSSESAPVITRGRHRALLQEALESLSQFSPTAPLELTCEEIRRAAVSVGKITGKIQVDDILDVVFRQFCIGK